MFRPSCMLFATILLAICNSSIASPNSSELLARLKRIGEEVPLTDPRTVYTSLGLTTQFRVRLLSDHVQTFPIGELKGTPYQSVLLVPYLATRQPPSRDLVLDPVFPNSSRLSMHLDTQEVCVTKADVQGVFGDSYKIKPMIVTDGGSGTYMTFQVRRPREIVGSVTFSFAYPEQCASSVSMQAPF